MKRAIRVIGICSSLLLIVGFVAFSVTSNTYAQPAALPTGLNLPPGQVTAAYSVYLQPADAAFHITLSGFGGGFDVQTGVTYLGWCLEDYPYPNSPNVTFYSSYDPNMPLDIKTYQSSDIALVKQGAVAIGDPVAWGEVNWVLNNKGTLTRDDIQNAIHLIVWGDATSTGPVSQNALDLVTAAKGHNSFVPMAGQTVAVILYVDGLGIANRAYQDTIIEVVMPPHPAITIVKYTNGQAASDPNGAGVPQVKKGDPVVWTYKVTNTGNTSIPRASVNVTDNEPGVTPVFDQEITGNGDTSFDPGEVWQYKATGVAVDLTAPPAGTIVQINACTVNGTQPPHTAYVNTGTATIPGATSSATSSYCNPPKPGVTIVKYTNGSVASDPNGSDVPQLEPGVPVTWTYKVTNTGNVSIPKANVSVTDSQTGVTPVFDKELTGNGDAIFDPGEVWQYKASGTTADLSLNPPGITIQQNGCTYLSKMPQSPAYVNVGTVTIPGATSNASSSYCNPYHYGENAYLGVEDWFNGDYDYNDFGMYFRIEEPITYACYNGVCGPYLTSVEITTTAVIHDSAMSHLMHLRRPFNGSYSYTITRSVPADPNPLTLFDGTTGQETPAGSYTGSGDLNVVLYNTAKYGRSQKQIGEQVVIDVTLNNPLLNPRTPGVSPRSYTIGSKTFTDLDPIMGNYDFWEEGNLYASRWHLKDTRPIGTAAHESFGIFYKPIPAGTVVPFLIVVPYPNWIPPFESSTINGPYGSFGDYYTTSQPTDWYLPSRVTNTCVQHGGLSFGPYPGQQFSCGQGGQTFGTHIFIPIVSH